MSTRSHALVIIVAVLAVALIPLFLLAQESSTGTPTSTPPERAQERMESAQGDVATRTEATREAIEERRATQEEVREERRAGLRQAALDRIQNLLGNMVRRMHAAIARLENIAQRLASRAEKVAAQYGVDVSAANAHIDDAENELASARLLLQNLIEETNGTLGEPEPRAQFLRVRAALGEARNHIATAHRMLREAVAALKSALGEEGEAGVSDAVRNDSATGTAAIEE